MSTKFNAFTPSASPLASEYAVGYATAISGGERRWLWSDVRTLMQANLNYINVKTYGAVGDGSTDDTAAIQATITAAIAFNGSGVFFPQGTYKITNTITVTRSNILLFGVGSGGLHDGGTNEFYSTALKWGGSAGGTMVWFETIAGVNNSINTGGGMVDISLDGMAVAGTGLRITSWRAGIFKRIYAHDLTVQSFKTDCLRTTTDIPEAADNQNNYLAQLSWRNIDSVAVQSAHGMVLDGSSNQNANTSFNNFIECRGQCYNGINYLLVDADNNVFNTCTAGRTNGTSVAGLEIRGGLNDGNTFIGFSCSGANAINIKGTASGYSSNSVATVFLGLDSLNSTAYPTFDAGCFAVVQTVGGALGGVGHYQAAIADTVASALTERSNLTTESLRIANASQNHAILTDGTNKWGLNIDGSGNLRTSHLAGTGYVVSAEPIAVIGNATVPTFTAPELLRLVAADGVSALISLRTYGTGPGYQGISFGGTAATPAATPSGQDLAFLAGAGYSTAATGNAAVLRLKTINLWAAGDTSTQLILDLTPSASTTRATALTVQNNSLKLSGSTSGSLTFSIAAATAQSVTVSLAAQTTGTTTLTLPDMAGVSDTFAFLAKNQTFTGVLTLTPAARSSGVAPYLQLNAPTDTAQTAATESPGVKFATATRTWATTGTVALQRENWFQGMTYASASASQTFTDITTVYVDRPLVGANAIFTRAHSLVVVDSTSAASAVTGGLIVATTLGTAATSVGIGGGNVFAGGVITANSTTDSASTASGAIITAGGIGCAKALFVGGQIIGSLSFTAKGAIVNLAANSVSLDMAGGTVGRIATFGTDTSTQGTLKISTFTSNAGAGTDVCLVASTGFSVTSGVLTTPGGATFHTTSTALTNGAGASAGTITNAPAIGNPTKWIGINDNGTTRYIPAW